MSLAASPRWSAYAPPMLLWTALLVIGLAWGATQPLSKFGMSAGHHPVAVTLWQALIGAVLASAALCATGRRLPLTRPHLRFFAVCGFLGTALPHSLSYTSIQHLPVGVQSIVLSTVPMMTLLIAIPFALDRAEPRRLMGLGLGFLGVAMLAGPETSLPDPGQALWIALPVIVALSYAAETVALARLSPPRTTPLETMCGLTLAASAMLTPVVLLGGIDPLPQALGLHEWALLAIGVLNLCAYTGLVWLIGRGGPVFASQIGYVVTATGVLSGILLFGETHSAWVWAALAATFAGLALVRPRRAQEVGRTDAVT